ncbi:DUF2764 family protein [bacterium]|nr:DUF2764 family protein [bacterium]
MAGFYYYICSLPLLTFGEELPMNSEIFIKNSSDWLTESETERLENLKIIPEEIVDENSGSIEKNWYNWETCLRNRLADFRAGKLSRDASEYIKEYPDYFSEVESVVQEITTITNPLSVEKKLDTVRWKKLNDMESGHEFDFEKLCIYKLKLMILEKWMEREEQRGFDNLDSILKEIYI